MHLKGCQQKTTVGIFVESHLCASRGMLGKNYEIKFGFCLLHTIISSLTLQNADANVFLFMNGLNHRIVLDLM